MRFSSLIAYEYNSSHEDELFSIAFKVLGFEPKYMRIFFGEDEKTVHDMPFDSEVLVRLLKNNPSTITVQSDLYENDTSLNWVRFSRPTDTPFKLKVYSIEWSSSNLDFLLLSKEFQLLLNTKNLMYCYCYNQYDCMEQSDTDISNYLLHNPDGTFSVTKNHLGQDVIDTSEHWGRYVMVQDLTFMAAPLMWFGSSFFQVIPKEALLSFAGYSSIAKHEVENVRISLFDLYDDPAKPENRELQKRFWNHFDLQNRIKAYELDNPVDYITWIRGRKNRKKKTE